MRKSNSLIRTAFLSEAGAKLANNDYYACIELDDYACYVVAAGITDFEKTEAAREAVENLLISFQENPTMEKRELARFLRETNQRLLRLNARERMKASVLMVVTNYEEMRYAEAGNIRLRCYRNSRPFLHSEDMSLASIENEQGLSLSPVDRHAERNNLYAYLGKPDGFEPFISERIKLQDGDIIAIYTKGIWENIDAGELDDVMSGAADEPRPVVDAVEDLLLSRQPQNLACYTLAAIFVNKVFSDPERILRRKKRIRYALIALLVVLLIAVLALVLNRIHASKVRQLEADMEMAQFYLQHENFVRARESCQKALEEAGDISTKKAEENRLQSYALLIDTILQADASFKDKAYTEAIDGYTAAQLYAKEADGYGSDYIERQISRAEEFVSVTSLLDLGDQILANGNLSRAEQIYFRALDKAGLLHDRDGRERAMQSIEKLYDAKGKQEKAAQDKLDKASAQAVQDALAKGDQLMQAGDFDGAEKAFQQARQLANAAGSREGRNDAMQALVENRAQKEIQASGTREASEAMQLAGIQAAAMDGKGDEAFAAGDYISAQVYYMSARDKYAALPDYAHAGDAQKKAELAEQKAAEATRQQDEAAAAARAAREAYSLGDYPQAMAKARQAKEAYVSMGDKANADAMQLLLDAIDTDQQIAAGMQ